MIAKINNSKIQTQNKSFLNGKIKLLGIVFLGFLLITIAMAVQSVNLGTKLAELEAEERKLLEEGERLSTQLVESSSLIQIGGKAEEMGFVKPSNIYYLQTEEFIAKSL